MNVCRASIKSRCVACANIAQHILLVLMLLLQLQVTTNVSGCSLEDLQDSPKNFDSLLASQTQIGEALESMECQGPALLAYLATILLLLSLFNISGL